MKEKSDNEIKKEGENVKQINQLRFFLGQQCIYQDLVLLMPLTNFQTIQFNTQKHYNHLP